MVALGHVCAWFFTKLISRLISRAIRMPFALWHASGEYGVPMIVRGVFVLFGILSVVPQIVWLLSVTLVMVLLGNACVWFFVGLIGSAIRMPFALWHLSGKHVVSIIARGVFVLFGVLQVVPQIVGLLIVTIGLAGCCFIAAKRTGNHEMHPRLQNEPA